MTPIPDGPMGLLRPTPWLWSRDVAWPYLYFRLVSNDLGFLENTAGVDSEKTANWHFILGPLAVF